MRALRVLSLKSLWMRLIAYVLLVAIVACFGHFYVTKPLFFKKLPYRLEAFWSRFDVRCEPGTPSALEEVLKDVSLPYYSKTSEIRYVDRSGKLYGCQVFDDSSRDDVAFRLASLTKVVTALSVLDLAERGKIDLETKLLDFFPEVNQGAIFDSRLRQISLNHLLSHSSGLGGVFGSDNMAEKGETPWCPYDFRHMEEIRLAGSPGTNNVYSNVAYCLLGEVVSRMTGMTYREYILQEYLAEYSSLVFVDGPYLPVEPEYDLSNEYRMEANYHEWLDFYALSASAGLVGDPAEFARLVWEKNRGGPRSILDGPRVNSCWERESVQCYSYPMKLHRSDSGDMLVGTQGGYLPGASSMLAVNERGEVLVWAAAGASVSKAAKKEMVDRVVAFLSSP